MNKITVTSIVSVMLIFSGNSMAGHEYNPHRGVIYDKARVVRVDPIVRTVRVSTPHQECYQEEVRRPAYVEHRPSDGAAVVGGIIGGVIGHKLGKGRGGATIAGTLVGAAIGKNSARYQDYTESYEDVAYENHCTTNVSYHTEERIEGYDVTYKYKGERFTTRMPYDPGKFVRVAIKVSPVVE